MAVTDYLAQYRASFDSYEGFVRELRFDNRDKVHQYVICMAIHFYDLLKAFDILMRDETPLTQAPYVLLRSMFETMVRIAYLAAVADRRDAVPSELLVRVDNLIYTDACERRKFVEQADKAFGSRSSGVSSDGEFNLTIANLQHDIKSDLSFYDILKSCMKSDPQAFEMAYSKYRWLSQKVHPSIIGMSEIWDPATNTIKALARTEDDLNTMLEAATSYSTGCQEFVFKLISSHA